MCNHPNPWVIREAALCFGQFTTHYDRMHLWFKFESGYIPLDSSNMCIPKLYGRPSKLPLEKGMNANWGAFFGYGDLIVLDKPIEFPKSTWSISFWMTIPVVAKMRPEIKKEEETKRVSNPKKSENDNRKQHTLVQSVEGVRYVVIDDEGLHLGIFDTEKMRYRRALKMFKLGAYAWHNIIITYQSGKIRYYADGIFKKHMEIKCEDPIKFIGNSADGLEPFGTFCDLRITETVLTHKQIRQYCCYAPTFNDVQPDHLVGQICDAVGYLSRAINLNIPPTTTAILTLFANLAANGKQ